VRLLISILSGSMGKQSSTGFQRRIYEVPVNSGSAIKEFLVFLCPLSGDPWATLDQWDLPQTVESRSGLESTKLSIESQELQNSWGTVCTYVYEYSKFVYQKYENLLWTTGRLVNVPERVGFINPPFRKAFLIIKTSTISKIISPRTLAAWQEILVRSPTPTPLSPN